MNEAKWQARIEAAAAALKTSNEDLLATLTKMGIESTEDLDDPSVFKFGDFREARKDDPIGLLRKAMKHLVPTTSTQESNDVGDWRTTALRALGFKVKLEDADTAQLLSLYLPDKPNDPVTNALRARFQQRPIVAFKEDGAVAVEETLAYVAGLEQGYDPQDTIMVGGKLVKLWPVGVKPDVMVEEDPLFPGHPLRNGCSTVNNRNWSQVSLLNRQFCRIVMERGDINPENREAILRLLERAQGDHGYDKLTEAYPEAELDLREKRKRSELPKLVMPLGTVASKPQNPFGVRRQY